MPKKYLAYKTRIITPQLAQTNAESGVIFVNNEKNKNNQNKNDQNKNNQNKNDNKKNDNKFENKN